MFDIQQASLFGSEPISFDSTFEGLERISLDASSWLDYQPLWLSGDDQLFAVLAHAAEWTQPVVKMFDREVLTPRLVAPIERQAHPIIPELIASLSARYDRTLDRVSAGWYRDGADSVAYHGDRVARERPDATVATVSLGSPSPIRDPPQVRRRDQEPFAWPW